MIKYKHNMAILHIFQEEISMKKLFLMLLCAMMLCVLALPVLAEDVAYISFAQKNANDGERVGSCVMYLILMYLPFQAGGG